MLKRIDLGYEVELLEWSNGPTQLTFSAYHWPRDMQETVLELAKQRADIDRAEKEYRQRVKQLRKEVNRRTTLRIQEKDSRAEGLI